MRDAGLKRTMPEEFSAHTGHTGNTGERGGSKSSHETGSPRQKEGKQETNGETRRAQEKRRLEEQAARREIIDEALKKVRKSQHRSDKASIERSSAKTPDKTDGESGEAAETKELVYEEELPIGKDLKFKVSVYKRADGTYVVNKLPTNKYDAETIKRILTKSGIGLPEDFPKGWVKASIDKKLELLKEMGLETLEGEFQAFRPTDWGYRDPNRQGPEPYGTFVSEMEFRDLVLEKWQSLGQQINVGQQQRLQQIDADIVRRIQSNSPEWVMDAYLDLTQITEEIRNDPLKLAELDQVLSQQLQQNLETAKNNLDVQFNAILRTAGEAGVADIKTAAGQELTMLTEANWQNIESSIERIRHIAAAKKEIPGREGLRAWYAMKQLEQLHEAYSIYKRTEVQVEPLENIRAAEEVMRFFEKSRTRDTFGLAQQRLVRMLQAVEKSNDVRVTPAIKERFRERFNSFEYLNSLLITMEERLGDPEKMWEIAVTFKNETWKYFYDRFVADELKDRNGNAYLVDANGNLLQLNLLSEAENVFTYQYLVDRWRSNRVQEMMLADLYNPALINNPDAQWLMRAILAQHGVVLAQNFNFANLTNAQRHLIDQFWNNQTADGNEAKGKLVNKWYVERTFMGASGYDAQDRSRKEIWFNNIIQWHLRKRLADAGVAQDRINALLGRLADPNLPFDPDTNPVLVDNAGDYELMSAVVRNAYDLAKFKLADTLDGVKVYQKDGKYITPFWGKDTPYIARAITDFAHWCKQEGQGDERVVNLLIDQLDVNWSGADVEPGWAQSGQILSQNATAERFFGMRDEARNELVIVNPNGPLATRIKNLIDQKAPQGGIDEKRDVEGFIWVNQLKEGIDPNNPNDINRELVTINWEDVSKDIEAYPVHDMLFDRRAVWNWYLNEFRPWLNKPFPQEFVAMMEKYYSFRNVRRHPGAEFFLELQWRLGQHWKDWYGYDENLSIAEFERYVEGMKRLDLIDNKRAKRLMERLFGSKTSLNVKEAKQLLDEGSKQTVRSLGWWGGTAVKFVTDVIWPFLRYLVTGK